jgi:hypothetical protein
MQSVWNGPERRQLLDRLATLAPEAQRKWGSMTAPQVVAHLADAARMALGDLPCESKRLPIRYFPLKQLVVYWLPFPKGVPTAPELIGRPPGAWLTEVTELAALVERLGREPAQRIWPEHPAFGRLSRRAWGVLIYRHMDHHLRQFGV